MMKHLIVFMLCFICINLISCKQGKEKGAFVNSDSLNEVPFQEEDYTVSGEAPAILEMKDITGNWLVTGLEFEKLELKGEGDSFSFSSFADSRFWSGGNWKYQEGELMLRDPAGDVQLSLISVEDSLINWENEEGEQVVFRKVP